MDALTDEELDSMEQCGGMDAVNVLFPTRLLLAAAREIRQARAERLVVEKKEAEEKNPS